MMAEGAGEVKKEAMETGAGGTGGRPTGAREPAGKEVAQQDPATTAAPLAVLCGMHCQGDGGCAALQARSNSAGER